MRILNKEYPILNIEYPGVLLQYSILDIGHFLFNILLTLFQTKQTIHKLVFIKHQQIFHFFSYSNKFYGDLELVRDG